MARHEPPASSLTGHTASLASRVRATFLAPGALATLLRRGDSWLDVLLISTAIALVSVATMPEEIFLEPMRDAVSRRGEPVEIRSPPETIVRWGRAIGMLATFATHPITAFTLAGVLTLVFVFLLKGTTNYRELLSLTAHAMLIPAAGTIVAIAVRLATGTERGPGLGVWLDPTGTDSVIVASLLSIDPFLVWMFIVIGVGLHGLDPKLSPIRSTILLLGGYLVLVLASTAILHPELTGEGDEVIGSAAAEEGAYHRG